MWEIRKMKKYVLLNLILSLLTLSCTNTVIQEDVDNHCISKISEYRLPKYLDVVSNEEIYNSVKYWSNYYNIDYSLILGLIVQESNYNIYATSCCDCRGLCQIAESTMIWYNNVNGKNYKFNEMYNYDKNIEVCCWLLRRLYDYSEVLGIEKSDILIAYNVGHRNVNKYKYKNNYKYHTNIMSYADTFKI